MHNTSFNTNEDGMESAGNNEQPNIKTEYPSHHEAENTLDVDKRGVKDKAVRQGPCLGTPKSAEYITIIDTDCWRRRTLLARCA